MEEYAMSDKIIDALDRNCQVKDYIDRHFCEETEPMKRALQRSQEEALKPIQIPVNVGKMIYLLAKLQKPQKILEVGTLGGYSTLWLAKALVPGGKVITLELHETNARVAKENFQYANLADQIEVRVGNALDLLEGLQAEGPFDVIFIDADKESYSDYLEPCLALSRSGTLLLIDDLIPKRGTIADPDPRDNEAIEVYFFNQLLAHHSVLDVTLFPTIKGSSGRVDALGVAIVK